MKIEQIRQQFDQIVRAWSADFLKRYMSLESEVEWMLKLRLRFLELGLIKDNADSFKLIGFLNEAFLIDGGEILKNITNLNSKRLKTLVKLLGLESITHLEGKKVISLGGGPGDRLCDPWFPRLASLTRASVTNFDISPALDIDQNEERYIHVVADIFDLLEKNKLTEYFKPGELTIIECNNVIGNNVSPTLAIRLNTVEDLNVHPEIIKLRKQLREISLILLEEGGILALDNIFYKKINNTLVPLDANGDIITTSPFLEERQLGY